MKTRTEVRRSILDFPEQEVNLEIWIEAVIKDRMVGGLLVGTIECYIEKLKTFVKFCNGRIIN